MLLLLLMLQLASEAPCNMRAARSSRGCVPGLLSLIVKFCASRAQNSTKEHTVKRPGRICPKGPDVLGLVPVSSFIFFFDGFSVDLCCVVSLCFRCFGRLHRS